MHWAIWQRWEVIYESCKDDTGFKVLIKRALTLLGRYFQRHQFLHCFQRAVPFGSDAYNSVFFSNISILLSALIRLGWNKKYNYCYYLVNIFSSRTINYFLLQIYITKSFYMSFIVVLRVNFDVLLWFLIFVILYIFFTMVLLFVTFLVFFILLIFYKFYIINILIYVKCAIF